MVTDFLTSPEKSSEYFQPFVSSRRDYNGYNLVLLEKVPGENRWSSNYFSNLDEESPCFIKDEIFSLSNSPLKKAWSKSNYGKDIFSNIIKTYQKPEQKAELTQKLLDMLNDKTQNLPDPILETQAPDYLTEELVRQRSAIFVESRQIRYGTRTNTVVTVDKDGRGAYTERTMVEPISLQEPAWSTQTFEFNV